MKYQHKEIRMGICVADIFPFDWLVLNFDISDFYEKKCMESFFYSKYGEFFLVSSELEEDCIYFFVMNQKPVFQGLRMEFTSIHVFSETLFFFLLVLEHSAFDILCEYCKSVHILP